MSYRKIMSLSASMLAIVIAAPVGAQTNASAGSNQAQADAATGLEEVVVTARRREERAQTTPVAVSAFSSSALKEQEVQLVQDLDTLVPGFRFASEGGKNTNNVVLRGLSRIPLGLGIPAVVTYFADVPLPGIAGNVPTYDLDNVQVLKGPQGTLFGRNTLGGAVVLSPVAPSNAFGGYLDFKGGNLGRFAFEGAINIPIVPDKVELRISGQLQRGDGYVKNLSGGPDMNDTDENSYRVSLRVLPTDFLTNTFVWDYNVASEKANSSYILQQNKGIFTALFTPALGPALGPFVGADLDAQVGRYLALQQAGGPRVGFTDLPDGGYTDRRLMGFSNRTDLDINDDISLRNILGLRKAYNTEKIDTGGVPTLSFLGLPFTLFDAGQTQDQEYLTEEFQIIGTSLNNKLKWILGAFYNNDWANGPSGSQFTAFSVGGVPAPAVTATIENHNYAIYGQAGIDLSDWVLAGLTFNIGYRYSWDEVHACGGVIGTAGASYGTSDQCEQAASLHVPGGPGVIDASGGDPSWTIGFDYKLSDKQFFYVTSRRGYRGVNVNTPLFSSPYTTGAVNPACAFTGGVCPDLRPFQKTNAEKLTDVEIGSKTDFDFSGVAVRLNLALYWSQYTNALQFLNTQTIVPSFAPDSPTNGSIGVNAADETIMGIEAGLTIQPTEDLTFTLNGSYNNSSVDEIHSPSALLNLSKSQITLPTPKFSGDIGVRWVLPYEPLDGRLVFNADIYGTTRWGAQDGQYLNGYSVTNARLDWQNIAGSNVDLALYTKNIFDKHYVISPIVLLPTFPISTGVIGEPRTYGVELRYTF